MSPKKVTAAPPAASPTSGSANAANPASLTPAQAQEWSYVLKKIEDNKWVVPAVLTAGFAGLLEILHLVFLAMRFLYHVIQGTWKF
jgi:hypothetical protein